MRLFGLLGLPWLAACSHVEPPHVSGTVAALPGPAACGVTATQAAAPDPLLRQLAQTVLPECQVAGEGPPAIAVELSLALRDRRITTSAPDDPASAAPATRRKGIRYVLKVRAVRLVDRAVLVDAAASRVYRRPLRERDVAAEWQGLAGLIAARRTGT